MSLKIRYILFILIIHVLLLVLIYNFFEERKIFFLVSEIGIVISLLLSFRLYRSFVKPLQFIYDGIDAIKDQDFAVRFLPTGQREMDKLIGAYNQMIDNIRIERTATQEQQYFLDQLIEASPAGILIFDYDDRLMQVNPKATSMFPKINLALRQPLAAIAHPVFQAVTQLKVGESRLVNIDGVRQYKCELAQFISKGFKQKFVVVQDLSQEIITVEKQAYGKVIRMMAHEVNNSIGAVNSILQTLQEILAEEDDMITSTLEVAIDRNQKLNQFMKNFADVIRLPAPVLERTNLNELLKKLVQFFRPTAQAQSISVELQLPLPIIHAQIDPKQIEQVLINVLKNAIEAIEKEGQIKIYLHAAPFQIEILDNGVGIVSDEIFTPFYSTKPDGQGIGLTLIKEILLNHKATFTLKTLESGWTQFLIDFGR